MQFYVQLNKPLVGANVIVTFQVERLNEGKAMNLTSGFFTAPVSGIYAFSFSTIKGKTFDKATEVSLYHNDQLIGTAFGGQGDRPTLSLQSILELKSGDEIYLVKGAGDHIHSSKETKFAMTTHFAGWLLESGF